VTDEQERLLAKASESIAAAKLLLQSHHAEFAVSRAYYAMFYLASAMLLAQNRRFKSHSGLHTAFAEHVTKAGLLPNEMHEWLVNAGNERIIGDYSAREHFTAAEATTHIERASMFFERVTSRLAIG